ncbi:DegT/DnrJ/EryC1/StrS family aminotransferase [Alteromonas mediterranea]|uniref:DegT/DnrJ/EryC1/StrS family aminotransferase n=1 Tax=Alteromonas mediterranea TaxID=314275 RepID=UPI0009C0C2FB|nr:DegT/DnrJ/EryC1/StrS family aminotransferase [Alteromonas mediterranea]
MFAGFLFSIHKLKGWRNCSVKSKIPVYQPDLSGNEKKYVNECLDSSWISSKGHFVSAFERSFADYTQTKHATSVSNGTVALHLALLALEIGPGDEVIVPSFTYIASVNAIRYVGATPIFADIEPESWQLDVSKLKMLINKNTKAIIAVHIYGHPCDMVSLKELALQNQLLLVEDCAEAFGSRIDSQHVGTFSDIATYSFFGNKTVTTGEGGMVVTQKTELDSKIRHLKCQGLEPGREYWHDVIGYNYRMTNICAAIGLAQLERAPALVKKKQDLAKSYQKLLAGLPLTFQQIKPRVIHSWWMFSILVSDTTERDALRLHLSNDNIETRPLFNPVHQMPMYKENDVRLPVTESIAGRGMNLPSWPGVTGEMIERICNAIWSFYK